MSEKAFLVTGATSGIGLALCELLLSEGNKVFATGRNEEALARLSAKYPDSMIFKSFDLSETDLIEDLIAGAVKVMGELNGFVHCAGIEETIPLLIYRPKKIIDIFNINIFSSIELLRVFSKKKHCKDGASVVFISSVMGVLGQPGKAGYCTTKAAILGLVRSAALELANRKIRVNAVSPGIVLTKMTENLFGTLNPESVQKIKDMHPLGIGQVEDVIPAISFLLSESSKWITGQNLIIDGGYSVQ